MFPDCYNYGNNNCLCVLNTKMSVSINFVETF